MYSKKRAHSSAEEHYVDIVKVIGSIPIVPTILVFRLFTKKIKERAIDFRQHESDKKSLSVVWLMCGRFPPMALPF